MRISSAFFGILAFIVLIVATAICSVTAYGFSRDSVVQLWASGEGGQVETIGEVMQAVINPEDFEAANVEPTAIVQIATDAPPTPTATDAPAQVDSVATEEITDPVDFNGQSQAFATSTLTPTPIPSPTPDLAQEAIQAVGPRDINILLMGIDERVGYTQESAYRTDTMIVVHVDPVRKNVGVLSFPRDLWVEIPNLGSDRLNNANYLGDLNAYPGGGGPALAGETIEANFGIRIDHYIMINFTVFETLVDILAPEGIPIQVRETIRDPDYPDAGFGFINVEFDPGLEYMSGERLLQYARTRATENSDLDRARRQQEVLEALRQHVLSRGGIQTFITQAGRLWTELAGSYRTSLTLSEITGLAYLMNEIERENIRYGVIGIGYIDPRVTNDERQILVPIDDKIQELIQQTFYASNTVTVSDLQAQAQAENATILVYNNTNIAGLAGRTREYLIGRGVRVGDVGNMPSVSNEPTYICNYGGAANTAEWVAVQLGLTRDRARSCNDGIVTSGVIVVAGSDIERILAGQ